MKDEIKIGSPVEILLDGELMEGVVVSSAYGSTLKVRVNDKYFIIERTELKSRGVSEEPSPTPSEGTETKPKSRGRRANRKQ
jgi:hypothetical protein